MPRSTLDKETKAALLEARAMIETAEKADCNEAETRRRIERIFESLMGYSLVNGFSPRAEGSSNIDSNLP